MKTGDYVTATQAGEYLDEVVKVTGRLEVTDSEFMGETWKVYTVHAEYEDGSDCPVEVQEGSIRAVNQRRAPVTQFPNPGE